LGAHADIKKEEVNEFLLRLNNAGANRILVIGATNRPQMIAGIGHVPESRVKPDWRDLERIEPRELVSIGAAQQDRQ
jgi:hypothetical protein